MGEKSMSEQNWSGEVDQVIDDLMQREQRHRLALSMLLEEQRSREGHVLAFRVYMGKSPSYVTAVSLRWVAANVHFAGDLPLFKGRVEENRNKVPVDEDTFAVVQQHQPDWTKQLPMTAYLATRENHKFPPLLVAGYQEWVYDRKSEEWGVDKKAMQDSVRAEPLLLDSEYCDLDTKGTAYYALDGQHRLMAIAGLKELLDKGKLPALDRNRNPKKNSGLSREAVIDAIYEQEGGDKESIHAKLMARLDESIGLEIIPAVCAGEEWRDALFRMRGIFADVNERAKGA